MEGQNRTAANAGKLCSNISIGIMVDYSFEKNVCYALFLLSLCVCQINSSHLIYVHFCVLAGVFGRRGEGQKHQQSPRTGGQHHRAKECCR